MLELEVLEQSSSWSKAQAGAQLEQEQKLAEAKLERARSSVG
jgi:hypothetical protein